MKNNFKYIINLDSEAKGYYPFTMLTIVLVFGVVVLFYALSGRYVSEQITNNYGYLFIGVLLLEILSLKFVFPNERVELSLNEDMKLEFRYIFEKEVKEIGEIKNFNYWWNHDHKKGLKTTDNIGSFSSNGGLGGASVASGLRLYLELKTENEDTILLYEIEGNWASTPHWKYRLPTFTDFDHKYKCFKLKKVIKQLQSLPIIKPNTQTDTTINLRNS